MKLKLYESGLRNIKELAKKYNEAWVYGHIDLDGITSSIAMREYLKQYGITTTNFIPIQYGSVEYSITRPPVGVMAVLVDFSHGKIFMNIHTDHHSSQISYNASNNFTHSKSNAGTISASISSTDIFPQEDIRVIDMVDSAGYADEDINVDELKNYIFNYNNEKTNIQNHLRFGMVVGKLLLAYKNKPNYLKTIVMESRPSLMSMFQVMKKMVKENGWADLKQLQKNSEWYAKSQEGKKIPEGTIETITSLEKGQNTLIGNTIVQIGGGNMMKSGAYDRYTAFKLYPQAKYFIMIWDSIGMMQVSKNNWNKENRTPESHNVDLGEIVIQDIFKYNFAPKLMDKKYDISLLAIKKAFEEQIERENLPNAIGFTYDEFKALFSGLQDISPKQEAFIDKVMKMKPQELIPTENDTEAQLAYKQKAVKFLNDFSIPFPEIVMKVSGGHPGITNLNGFEFLNMQRRIYGAINHGRNPYAPLDPNWKPDPNRVKKDSIGLSLLKQIAIDVVSKLNNDEEIIHKYDDIN